MLFVIFASALLPSNCASEALSKPEDCTLLKYSLQYTEDGEMRKEETYS